MPTNNEQNFYKTLKDFNLKKSFQNIAPSSWDKIVIRRETVATGIWSDIVTAFRENNSLMFNSNDRFISQEVYQDFSNFIDPNTMVDIKGAGKIPWKNLDWQRQAINETWITIVNWFKNANKVFKSDGSLLNSSCSLVSQEACSFLRKYIGASQFNISYSSGSFLAFEEFKNDKVMLNDQVIIVNQQEVLLKAENTNLQILLNQRPTQTQLDNLQQQLTSLNALKNTLNISFPNLINSENQINETVHESITGDSTKLQELHQQLVKTTERLNNLIKEIDTKTSPGPDRLQVRTCLDETKEGLKKVITELTSQPLTVQKEIDRVGIKKVIVRCSELANKELREVQDLIQIAVSEQEKEAYRKEQRELETIIEQAKQVVLQLNTKLVDKEVEQVQAQILQLPKAK